MYFMVTVLSETRRLKAVLKELDKLGIKGSIVVDSLGTNSIQKSYSEYKPVLESSLISISEATRYKKTILSAVENEELIEEAMEAVSKILGSNLKKPNTGIMFTIPMVGFIEGSQLNQFDSFELEDYTDK